MFIESSYPIVLTAGGGTINLPVTDPYESYYISGTATLVGSYTIQASGSPLTNTKAVFNYNAVIDLNGNTLTIFGLSLDDEQALQSGTITSVYNGSSWDTVFNPDFENDNIVEERHIVDGSITALKYATASIGNAPLQDNTIDLGQKALDNSLTGDKISPTAVDEGLDLSTDVINVVYDNSSIYINGSNQLAIKAGGIVNAMINAAAAIAWTKLATGAINKVVVTNGAGVLTTSTYLDLVNGGLGQDLEVVTGNPLFDGVGGVTFEQFSNIRDLHVSFETNSLGPNYITFPYDVTVSYIEVRVETEIDVADDAELTVQDHTLTNMIGNNLTAGVLTLTGGANTGNGFTSTLTANNVIPAGQRMVLSTNKPTPGGTVNIQVTYTRN